MVDAEFSKAEKDLVAAIDRLVSENLEKSLNLSERCKCGHLRRDHDTQPNGKPGDCNKCDRCVVFQKKGGQQ